MLEQDLIVDVPEGAIVRTNRIVLWTTTKNYLKNKQYNKDQRAMIGKTVETDRSHMYPNDNYKAIFPSQYAAALRKKSKKIAPAYQSIGVYVVLKTIAEKLPLYKLLEEVFGKPDADQIMDYAMYQIIYQSDVSQHYETSMLDKAIFSEKVRSDTYLSKFFSKKLTEDKISYFLENWSTAIIKYKKLKGVYLNVDGSNVDDEAEGVTLKELGHDKSGKGTTIVNMMYAVAPDGTGITYHQYRGSVIDQKAVKYLILYFGKLKTKILGLCVDRGFVSKQNTDMLRDEGLEFVMMLTSKPEGFTEAKNQLRESIRGQVSKWIRGTELFGDTTQVRMFKGDKTDSHLHVYYESDRGGKGIKELLHKINRTKAVAQKRIMKGLDPEIPKDMQKYVSVRKGPGPKTLEEHPENIQETLDDKGFHVLATSKEMTAHDAYKIYHARDSSEKQYMFMKTELGLDTYRTGSDKSIAGKQFVAFIAGILRNEILLASKSMLEEEDREDRYSVPAIIKELETIKMTRLPGNDYALVMDFSERDKLMMKHLGLNQKTVEEYAAKQKLRIKGVNR